MRDLNILGIDTSCDETSVAVLKGTKVLSNLMPSQSKLHSEFGGVVPSLAKLEHQKTIDSVVERAVRRSGLGFKDIDLIAVTQGPGLAIALEVGIRKAKELAIQYKIPVVAVNHMEGHLLSSLLNTDFDTFTDFKFPTLGILVSGGHTEIIQVDSLSNYKKIGQTLDDACGECFDKCGRMLGLGYPAGKTISEFAKRARKKYKTYIKRENKGEYVYLDLHSAQMRLPVGMTNADSFDMSFSGLKTAFGQLVSGLRLRVEVIEQLCLILEIAAYRQITNKLNLALKSQTYKSVIIGGGVSASARFRSEIRTVAKRYDLNFFYPDQKFCGDNAAMIALSGLIKANFFKQSILSFEQAQMLDREPNLSI